LNWRALVAEAVRRRKQEGLTQAQLGAIAGVSQPTVWRFERGDHTIRLKSALDLLDALALLEDGSVDAARQAP